MIFSLIENKYNRFLNKNIKHKIIIRKSYLKCPINKGFNELANTENITLNLRLFPAYQHNMQVLGLQLMTTS